MKRRVRLVLVSIFVAFLAIGATAVTQSSDFTPNPTTVDNDNVVMVPSLSFSSGDFGCGGNFDITDVNVRIGFDKTDGSCNAPATGPSFLDEVSFSVASSAGANVVLIATNDYSGNADISPGVTVTYDQSAPPVTTTPTTGTFSPVSGNLDALNESGLSSVTYTLTAGDDSSLDPLCMFNWAVIATATCSMPPPQYVFSLPTVKSHCSFSVHRLDSKFGANSG